MMKQFINRYILLFAWAIALISTVGSLYAGEILQIPMCIMCWYQRICMYPMVVILGVSIIRKNTKDILYFVLPFSIVGIILSFYHHLLQMGVIQETLAPCIQGISCATKYLFIAGFITFPLISFIAFSMITLSVLLFIKTKK